MEGGTLDAVVTGQQGGNQVKQDAAENKATTPPNEQKSPEKAPPEVPWRTRSSSRHRSPCRSCWRFPQPRARPSSHTQRARPSSRYSTSRPQLKRPSQRRQVLALKIAQEQHSTRTTNHGGDSAYLTHRHSKLESIGTRKQQPKSIGDRQEKPSLTEQCNIELMKP